MELPFDPTRSFHDCRFDYGPNGVVFYAAGEPVQEFTQGILERPMRLYVNAWYPDTGSRVVRRTPTAYSVLR